MWRSASLRAGLAFCPLATAGQIPAFEALVDVSQDVVNMRLFCFDGHDVHGTLAHFGAKRCYTFTGAAKDGFTFPLHVAAESGHKVRGHRRRYGFAKLGAPFSSTCDAAVFGHGSI